MTGSQKPFILSSAAGSNGVSCMLMMHSLLLFFNAKTGTLADGLTVSDEPIHTNKSHWAACSNAFLRSSTGSFSPK